MKNNKNLYKNKKINIQNIIKHMRKQWNMKNNENMNKIMEKMNMTSNRNINKKRQNNKPWNEIKNAKRWRNINSIQ